MPFVASVAELRTERLLLRQWRDADLDAFAALNADPEVMRHLPARLSRPESDQMAGFIRGGLEERGWGLWAVGVPGGDPFVGFVGLNPVRFDSPFTPAVEVGWRLARTAWGHGYATEAARAAVDFGFEQLGLDEIVSFTVAANRPSWRVMERLAMSYDPAEEFDHPTVPEGPLRRHRLYRLARSGAQKRDGTNV
jgi:RimJ/RimL family protein N-acetyltransferase